MMNERKGNIQTVLGLIHPSQLGVTLTHEHLLIDSTALYVKPPPGREEGSKKGFELTNLGWLRYFPYSHDANLHVDSEEISIREALDFKRVAGENCAIVDVTTEGIRSQKDRDLDILALKRISEKSGVRVICGCGYYIDKAHPREVEEFSIQELAERMKKDLIEGIGSTGIKAGVIGELGCSWPLTEREKKVLVAAAKAQQETGAPMIIHPGRNEDAPLEIARILKEAGANMPHVVMSHLDRTLRFDDLSRFQQLAEFGLILELDLFGTECSYYQQNESFDMASDGQRIQLVKDLIDVGLVEQIVLSHDIHTRHRLIEFGGHGFAHLSENIVPRMELRGISKDGIHTMMVKTPRRWLTFFK